MNMSANEPFLKAGIEAKLAGWALKGSKHQRNLVVLEAGQLLAGSKTLADCRVACASLCANADIPAYRKTRIKTALGKIEDFAVAKAVVYKERPAPVQTHRPKKIKLSNLEMLERVDGLYLEVMEDAHNQPPGEPQATTSVHWPEPLERERIAVLRRYAEWRKAMLKPVKTGQISDGLSDAMIDAYYQKTGDMYYQTGDTGTFRTLAGVGKERTPMQYRAGFELDVMHRCAAELVLIARELGLCLPSSTES